MSRWTQSEGIAFECAREAITDIIAIRTEQITQESNKPKPDLLLLAKLRSKRTRLVQKRTVLHVEQQDKISRIRKRYGKVVSALRSVR